MGTEGNYMVVERVFSKQGCHVYFASLTVFVGCTGRSRWKEESVAVGDVDGR